MCLADARDGDYSAEGLVLRIGMADEYALQAAVGGGGVPSVCRFFAAAQNDKEPCGLAVCTTCLIVFAIFQGTGRRQHRPFRQRICCFREIPQAKKSSLS